MQCTKIGVRTPAVFSLSQNRQTLNTQTEISGFCTAGKNPENFLEKIRKIFW